MDANAIITIISTVGFPIAVCLILFAYQHLSLLKVVRLR